MLSLHQAIEIKESIKSYLQATFTFRKRKVAQAFDDFIEHPELGMFKGPFVSLKLHFVKANQQAVDAIPLTIKPNWPPYDHQVKSWTRLSTQNKQPEPTIVTTGTGSGKTESFLYPMLDYCFQQQHRLGIKVIILYPMNALATDQAKRLAEMIYEDERLRGKIRAGLFIGEGNGVKGQFPKIMGEQHIIEHRDSILDAPPDILLTNFKMLDYALMKYNYQRLWSNNLNDKTLFQFLVLDELHTYDGAQGTDVANLIRRLKLKLEMSAAQLCPVGTSATIGSGETAPLLLAEYARKVFGEEITTEAIITENRISPLAFFGPDEQLNDFIPLPNRLKNLEFKEQEDFAEFMQAQMDVWQQDKDQLAAGLMQLKIVKDLVMATNTGNAHKTVQEIIRELSILNESYRKLAQWDAVLQYSPKERVLESLLSLIALAKDVENPKSPFMYLQVQLWIRELSGVQYTLADPAAFSFRDQVDANKEVSALPPWYCRECNSSGWLGVKADNKEHFVKDINEVYEKFFAQHKNVYFIVPKDELSHNDFQTIGYQPDDFLNLKIDPIQLQIVDKDKEGFEIQAIRKLKDNKTEQICPCCGTANTIAIIGTKIPTLSSIAVSQTLATDLDKAITQERKVLAFTNSVQDAAHQAGFIEARNYRFTFRASVQKVINELNHPVPLNELVEQFMQYWKANGDETGLDHLSGYLYRFFPKDYLGKVSPENYKSGQTYAPYFLTEFDQRIAWEIFSEFGFNSKIGRTLEKTGASSVYFDTEKLQRILPHLKDWLATNDVSATITENEVLRFTNMILHRARNRGAIDHPFFKKFRTDKLSLWDLNWQKDSRHFLNPKFGTRSRLPKLLTAQQSRDNLLDSTKAKNSNWFHAYFRKSFPLASVTPEFVNEFFEQWLLALTQAEILDKSMAGDHESYALNANAIWVAKNVKQYCCTTCEDTLYTNDEATLAEDAACLTYRCAGTYHLSPAKGANYYKAVYNRNRFPRVYAREHTGLLERKDREKLEIDFKTRPRFNATNALIATSTLEMGIDIGSLNTAYNNSVPPLPSNFLQRVGRAGRSSGAALIVNFAKNQNHDLYYYADPMAMMQGDVNTPGCYLEAKDILRRHFTAYCIDCWTGRNPQENTIPTFVRDLKLYDRDLAGTSFFINRLNDFIEQNKLFLTASFLKQYDAKITEEVFPNIEKSLQSGMFYDELLQVFIRLKEEILAIDKRRKELDDELKILNIAKGDPLFDEYVREKRNLSGIKKSIAARNVLEHLTNVGFLPNYAFPETGVKLNAHVFSNKIDGTLHQSLDKEFELIRPATQAIKELAPENFFYTQGYRFEVTGVNTFDWSDKNNHHTKRFCSKCDHLEINSLATKGNCPKCGDASWTAASNVHTFVKLTQVKSISNMYTAILSDANDDRELVPYQILQHVTIDPKSSEGAWVLKDIPFGIEYVKNASITSVNYGRNDGNDARKIKIQDTEALTKGFVTCRHCGKSVSSTHLVQETRDFHYGYCKHKDVRYQPNQTDVVFEELYFFREMNTELLKIILPIQEFNSETDIRMFQAGLELGLKKYFKGNPGHIQVQSYTEFNQHTEKFDRFLLLYDTIPGGTGYLEQLFDHKEFTLLLRLCYEGIRDCSCQLTGHDGCYKCIYSYGNQYNREDLSRARAEKWFEKIYQQTEEWIRTHNGLTSLTNTGKIEESELEERFVKLFQIYAEKQEGWSWVEKKENSSVYYQLNIDQGDVQAEYLIRPQIVLGPKNGIEFNTRTDFLISCNRYVFKNQDYQSQIPKIALYLDGYQFHASENHNVFERDLKIRKAIVAHNDFKTWTLTWNDLDLFQKELEGDKSGKDALSQIFTTSYELHYLKLLSLIKTEAKVNYALPINNVSRICLQLLHPPIEENKKSWYFYLASFTNKLLDPSFNPSAINKLVAGTLTQDRYIQENRITNFDGLVAVNVHNFPFLKWQAWVNIAQANISNYLTLQSLATIEKPDWEQFWNWFNLYQSDHFIDAIEENVEEMNSEQWENSLLEMYEEDWHPLLQKAIQAKLITEFTYETADSWLDEDGNILADAELVLTTAKIVVEPLSQESANIFTKGGFTIYKREDLQNIEL